MFASEVTERVIAADERPEPGLRLRVDGRARVTESRPCVGRRNVTWRALGLVMLGVYLGDKGARHR